MLYNVLLLTLSVFFNFLEALPYITADSDKNGSSTAFVIEHGLAILLSILCNFLRITAYISKFLRPRRDASIWILSIINKTKYSEITETIASFLYLARWTVARLCGKQGPINYNLAGIVALVR